MVKGSPGDQSDVLFHAYAGPPPVSGQFTRFCRCKDSNLKPQGPQAEALTTTPRGHVSSVALHWLNYQIATHAPAAVMTLQSLPGLVPDSQYFGSIGPFQVVRQKKYFGRKCCDVQIRFDACGGPFGVDF